MALLVFVVVPGLALTLAATFGGALAAIEGWSYRECFYLVLAELTSTNLEVTDHDDHATTAVGRLAACLVGLLSLAIFAAVLGIIGEPHVNVLLFNRQLDMLSATTSK